MLPVCVDVGCVCVCVCGCRFVVHVALDPLVVGDKC